jgi:hypothetical protein
MKTCSKCGECKAHDGFHADARNKDGRSNRCKVCAIKNAREHYANNKPPPKPRTKKPAELLAKNDPDRMAEYQRRWAEKVGRETLRARARAANKSQARREKNTAYRKSYLQDPTNAEQEKANNRKRRERLSDGYLRAVLTAHGAGLRAAEIPQQLIDLKRESILLKRLGKQIKEAINPTKEKP